MPKAEAVSLESAKKFKNFPPSFCKKCWTDLEYLFERFKLRIGFLIILMKLCMMITFLVLMNIPKYYGPTTNSSIHSLNVKTKNF